MIEISVIIPFFNGKKYIELALNSILNQTIKNLEVIIINDGSTCSESTVFIERLIEIKRDKRIRYIIRKNQGLSATRNQGMDLARGKYISFLDQDDVWDLNFLEKSLEVCSNTGASICFSLMRYIDASGNIKRKLDSEKYKVDGDLSKYLVWRLHIGISCIFFEKNIIKKVGYFNSNLRQAEDYEFLVRASRYFNMACTSELLVSYRVHSNSSTANQNFLIHYEELIINNKLAIYHCQVLILIILKYIKIFALILRKATFAKFSIVR